MSEDQNGGGYKNPPKHTQYKKGQSGNPKGRPSRSKNIKTLINKEMAEEIVVKESGVTKKLSKGEALIKAIFNHGMKKPKISDLITLQKTLGEDPFVLSKEEVDENLYRMRREHSEFQYCRLIRLRYLDGYIIRDEDGKLKSLSAPEGYLRKNGVDPAFTDQELVLLEDNIVKDIQKRIDDGFIVWEYGQFWVFEASIEYGTLADR